MMRKVIAISIFCLALVRVSAQNTTRGQIQVLGKCINDSVVLRWAPSNDVVWQEALKGKYTIERTAYLKDTTKLLNEPFQKIASDIQCLSLEEMKTKLGSESEFGAIAAQAVYGKDFVSLGKNAAVSDIINASEEQANRYTFALFAAENDAKVAEALGLRFADKTVKKGYYYVYKIYLTDNPNAAIDTGYCIVSTLSVSGATSLPLLQSISTEKAVILEWDATNFDEYYSGYYVEKRKKGTKEWKRLNTRPLVRIINEENSENSFFLTDSLLTNYEVQEYRLIGITPFAETIVANEVHEAFAKDVSAPSIATDLATVTDKRGKMVVSWKKIVIESDFAGFYVQKAYAVEGPFVSIHEKMLSKNTTQYVDDSFTTYLPTYYRILTIDTAKNASHSFSIYAQSKDSLPPAVPAKPSGEISKNGIVSLKWNLGQDLDIMGYRVYRANQSDHQFINLTPEPLTDTTFIDTISLKTLTKNIYYKIVAVDYNFNHSGMSELLTLKRPDIIKPASPIFHNVLVSDTAVVLSWYKSPSEDIKQIFLLRQQDNGPIVVYQNFKDKNIEKFVDTKLQARSTFRYFLLAIDDSNLSSDTSMPVDAYIYVTQNLAPIKSLKLGTTDNKKVNLFWSYPSAKNGYYIIYRSYNQGQLVAYKNAVNSASTFEDWELVGKGEYQYAISFVYDDGRQTPLSNKQSIIIK